MRDEQVNPDPAVQWQRVSKRRGEQQALAEFSLSLARGRVTGLIGPNGAGKTTFVNVLSGFQRPNAGRVRLGTEDITSWKPAQRARAGLVRTFQAVRLFDGLTVLENVEVAALAQGRPRLEARRRAVETLEALELAPHAAALAASLPYGLERRVGVARALVMDPDFLLLDEPAAGFNPAEKEQLSELILRIRDDGYTVLLVEHDMRLVMGLTDRIVVLDFGRKLTEGSPEKVRTDPAVIKAYLGEDDE